MTGDCNFLSISIGKTNSICLVYSDMQVQEAKLRAEEEAEERRLSKGSADENGFKPPDEVIGSQEELDNSSLNDALQIGQNVSTPEIFIDGEALDDHNGMISTVAV